MFDIANYFSSVKIALAALKIVYLDTYNIFFNAFPSRRSEKYNNKDDERTVTLSSLVHNLSLSYTDPSLISEFS